MDKSGIFRPKKPASNAPFAEFLVMSPAADRIVPVLGNVFVGEPLPENGYVTVPDKPGFGLEIDRSHVTLERPFGEQERP